MLAAALVLVYVALSQAALFCESDGNVYTPFPGSECRKFDHRQGKGPVADGELVKAHDCPPGLKFDVNTCTCDFESRVSCTPDPPPFCVSKGNVYTIVPGTRCATYDHRKGSTPTTDPVNVHHCPPSTFFDTTLCTCNYIASAFDCFEA